MAGGPPAALAAKAATTAIPVVFTSGDDPVRNGLVASLNRPGGNLTGVSILLREVQAKRLELLHELVPSASAVGLLARSSNEDTEAAASRMGLQLYIAQTATEDAADFTRLRRGFRYGAVFWILMLARPHAYR